MVLLDDIKEVVLDNILTEHYNMYLNKNHTHSFVECYEYKPLALMVLELNVFYRNMVSNLIHITKCNIIQAGFEFLEHDIEHCFNQYYNKYKDDVISSVIDDVCTKDLNLYRLKNAFFGNPQRVLNTIERNLTIKNHSNITTTVLLCLDKVSMYGVTQNG